ncbi:MAG: CBS domain-containing protein [Gallionella sp.]|nr:CBS domain-containing protein [Gallionella sp.]
MTPQPGNSLLAATAEHLRRYAPFDQMEAAHLHRLAARLRLAYYHQGEVLLSPEQGTALKLLIIKQGGVQGEQDVARAQEDAAWLELHEGECFPLGALLARRAVTGTYRARTDTFCYELDARDFFELMHLSVAFHDFCTRRIANLLEQSKHIIQAQYSRSSSEQQSMTSRLSEIMDRAPITCSPQTAIRTVLQTMRDHRIGSMVAVEDGIAVGMFTLHDVLNRVALPQADLTQPIIGVMSQRLTTLPSHALAYEAMLAMAREGIRHLLVSDHGKFVGVLSEKDLFTLQRVSLRQVSQTIHSATTLDDLKHAAHNIRQLGQNMLAQGIAAEHLTQLTSTLNDLLSARIIELECVAAGLQEPDSCQTAFCWLALGSEGRLEQTFHTDQDNGIIFITPRGQTPEAVRGSLLPVAEHINTVSAACGFPLCKGGIMASNPRWCLSLEEWKNVYADWIARGDAPELLNASIFFDFRALSGNVTLAAQLRAWLHDKIKDNRRFLQLMAGNALGNHPPVGVLRDFAVGKNGGDNTLDLKVNGITPFVDAARIFALASGSNETNTVLRLRAAGTAWQIKADEIDAWAHSFHYIQLLRLRLQHEQVKQGKEFSNRVDPDTLNELDRRILKEAFRQARKLQKVLENYFTF